MWFLCFQKFLNIQKYETFWGEDYTESDDEYKANLGNEYDDSYDDDYEAVLGNE